MRRASSLLRRALVVCAVMLCAGGSPSLAATVQPTTDKTAFVRASMAKLPLYFTPNVGQWDSRVRFKARAAAGELFLADDHAALTVPEDTHTAHVLRLRPVGARHGLVPQAGRPATARMYFHQGNDPAKWRDGVATCDDVVYSGVYPGIDLRYHGDNRLLEYDFLVAPGADPGRIRMRLEGADAVRLSSDGSMVVTLPGGRELRQAAPVLYQEADGVRTPVAGAFRLDTSGGTPVFGFDVAAYDPAKPLVIDPTLTYSTFLAGAKNDLASAVAISHVTSGNPPVSDDRAIVVGTTYSSDFSGLTVSVLQGDMFITCLSSDATRTNFVYLVGGSNLDEAKAVVANSTYAYVTGYTKSPDFQMTSPADDSLTNPLWPTLNGTKADAVILGFDISTIGSPTVRFSTYFGGSGSDIGNAIALDSSGNVYVAGTTDSTDMPVKNALYPTNAGGDDGFLLKLNSTGTLLHYATYFGGEKDDAITSLAITGAGDAVIAGSTLSAHLPVKNAIQAAIGSNSSTDGFVARINATCDELVFATYFGGSGADVVNALALDASGNVVLAGTTASANFPTKNALFPSLGGSTDAFVSLIDVSGRFVRFSTYLGGTGADAGTSVAVDQGTDGGLQYIYVGGSTASSNFPTVNAWSTATASNITQNGYGYRGTGDGFVAKFEPHGTRLVYASYLGGPGVDAVHGLATATAGTRAVYLVGETAPSTKVADAPYNMFPVTTGVVEPTRSKLIDAFATKMTDSATNQYATDVPTLSLSFPSAAPLTGTTVNMTMTYADAGTATHISAISTTLGYDPAVVEVTNVVLNTASTYSNFLLRWEDDASGTLRAMVYQQSGAAQSLPTGVLATVTFRVKYTEGSVVSQVTNTPTASTTGDVPVRINGYAGQVILTQRCSLLGDCDCSGTVQLWEAQQAMRKWLGQITRDSCVMADYTSMTATDIQQIINNHLYRTASRTAAPAAFCPADAAAGASLIPGPARTADGVVTVPLQLHGGTAAGIATVAADIAYDDAQFADVQVVAGAAATAAGKSVMAYAYEPGKLRLGVVGFSDRQTLADGELARIVLTPRVGAQGARGLLQVTATAATPEASAVPLAASSCPLSAPLLDGAMQLLLGN